MKVKVIGIGGVGLWLVDPLCMFLSSGKGEKRPSVTLIDGDRFEERNRDRQLFYEEGNKAEVTVTRLERLYGSKILFYAESSYIDEVTAIQYIREGDIVLAGVDNHTSRRIISNRCEHLNNVVCIAGGNDYHDGGIQCHIRRNGTNVTLPLANDWHPEILSPPVNNHPAYLEMRRGCEAEVKSSPQLVFANLNVAAMMLNAFYAYLQGKLDYDEAIFDVIQNKSDVERRSKVG